MSAFDQQTGQWVTDTVAETFQREYTGTMVSLTVGGETLRSTARHPFWVVRGEGLSERPVTEELGDDNAPAAVTGRWVEAQYLRAGDMLLTREHGEMAIEEVASTEETLRVYNLHVADCRTYAVGECGVLVHNVSAPAKKWPTCNKMPPSGHAREYQIRACGITEYEISGNGKSKCADAVEGTVVVDCKSLTTPGSSPQIAFVHEPAQLAGLRKPDERMHVVRHDDEPCSAARRRMRWSWSERPNALLALSVHSAGGFRGRNAAGREPGARHGFAKSTSARLMTTGRTGA